MKITVLAEDQARVDSPLASEHGLSLLIEFEGKKILFDLGQTDAFLRNAKKLEVNLDGIDFVVLSHGHYDHTGGLRFFTRKTRLVAHPTCFGKKYGKQGYIGCPFTLEEMRQKFDIVLAKKPFKISENIIFLGEIPRKNSFEGRPCGYLDEKCIKKDFLPDDSALAIKTEKGLAIISGCSHSGICNIIEYAKKATGQGKVHAVIGGFHLIGNDAPIEETIEYLKSQQIANLLPCHCTGLPALSRLYQEFKIRKPCTGDVLEL